MISIPQRRLNGYDGSLTADFSATGLVLKLAIPGTGEWKLIREIFDVGTRETGYIPQRK
jgi:hypothetical protein